MAADEGKVGGGGVAAGGQPGGEVPIQQHELTGVKGCADGISPSSRAVVPGGREPRGVVGVKIAHNNDVVVGLLEEQAKVGEVPCRTGGGRGDIKIEDLEGGGAQVSRNGLVFKNTVTWEKVVRGKVGIGDRVVDQEG